MIIENIRRIVRSAAGYDSVAYRAGAAAFNTVHIVRREGFGMLATVKRLRESSGGVQSISFRNLRHPIELRPGIQDISAVLDTVVREEYGVYLPDKELFTMIDAGAFIGDTSAYFLSRFPDLRVWALEPNPSNFALACTNLARYGDRARVLPLALCAHEGTVHFSGDGPGGSISEGGYEVEATTIPALLAQIPRGRVDLLKMDIEGAEMAVFAAGSENWLPKVDLIIVELHGPEITRSVLQILSSHGFEAKQYRSIWYCRRCGV